MLTDLCFAAVLCLTDITVSDIFITVNVINIEGGSMRDYGKGGALTEVTFYILLALYTPVSYTHLTLPTSVFV